MPQPVIGVVVPVYDVADLLPACLDSILAQTHADLHVVVVDDGSRDASGAIADDYAARDARVEVVHTANHGLGAARNEGIRRVRGEYLAFADSDDAMPPGALATLLASLEGSGSDFATGSVARWEGEALTEPPWMARLHTPGRTGLVVADHPEVMGDVFAWNKLFRRTFWDGAGLDWPEGLRYEDQPTLTRAYLAGRFDVLSGVVYHWRIRSDGSSITQQRSSLADLRDRFTTKEMSLASVEEYVASAVAEGDRAGRAAHVRDVFLDRVLAGDLHRYFDEIPGCTEEWWALLVEGVRALWGDRGLTGSVLTPAYRLVGWLVLHGRREQAAAVVAWMRAHRTPLPRRRTLRGTVLDVPGVDLSDVDRDVLRLPRRDVPS